MAKAELQFSVDSAILSELGERLVERSYIALAELVKNAYDADATEVNLGFCPENDKEDSAWKITISDNGTGMTLDNVKKFWMRIGTTHKINDFITKNMGEPRPEPRESVVFTAGDLAHVFT